MDGDSLEQRTILLSQRFVMCLEDYFPFEFVVDDGEWAAQPCLGKLGATQGGCSKLPLVCTPPLQFGQWLYHRLLGITRSPGKTFFLGKKGEQRAYYHLYLGELESPP